MIRVVLIITVVLTAVAGSASSNFSNPKRNQPNI